MRKNNPIPIPSKQSPLAILMLILQFAKNLIRQFWPVLLILLINRERAQEYGFLAVILSLSVFSTLGSIISYFRFYIWMDDTHFYLNKGIFSKQKLQIPFERIQAIKLEQNLFHQFFNITQLEIETAGSKGSELKIHALSMEAAQSIRSYIFERKSELIPHNTDATVLEEQSNGYDEGNLLFSLPFSTLVKIGLSHNHLRTLGLILLFLFAGFERILEFALPSDSEIDLDQTYSGLSLLFNIGFIVFLMTIFLMGSVGYSIVQSSIKYADFMVYRTREGLRIIGGLFNRIEQVVVRRKIQMIVLDTNPIRRLLRLQRVRFFQASGDSLKLNESILVPGCSQSEADALLEEYADPGLLRDAIFKKVQPVYAVRYFLITLVVPLMAITGIAIWRFGIGGFWLLSMIPVLAFIAWLHYQRLEYALTTEFLIVRKGIFHRTYSVLRLYKIQSIDLFRGFYELRRGDLGSIIVHSAARRLAIPFLKLDEANQIFNYLTKKVETDRRHWI
jgi:putative membrane protein